MGFNANSLFSLVKASYMCFFLFVVGCSALPPPFIRKVDCPFHYMLHFGDGFFDIGNAFTLGSLPVNNEPYGITYPGYPAGRWCDGLTDIDIGGAAMGFTVLTPYLAGYNSSDTAVVFAVVDSPVLDLSFFASRNVSFPSYVAPLSTQLTWFQNYLYSTCSTPTECREKAGDVLFILGDVEANDIIIPLIQGKSFEEVGTYVPYAVEAQISAARELIGTGATRVIIPGNAPVGCYPYTLTALGTDDPTDYDDLGCLSKINDLVRFKNDELQIGIKNLSEEFPDITLIYADIYNVFLTVFQDSLTGPNRNVTLKACCGTGGEYNFDSTRFCGTSGVSACADPGQYIHWDGVHLTQNANNLISQILQQGVFPTLNCTSTLPFSSI